MRAPIYWPLRLTVRTPPFHGGNTDSNSVGVTSYFPKTFPKNRFPKNNTQQLINLPCSCYFESVFFVIDKVSSFCIKV